MYDNSYYPTPPMIAKKMQAELGHVSRLLEPSAGTGHLLDNLPRHSAGKIDLIEINGPARMHLRGKGYNVIHDDFMTFVPVRHYDGIIMNPPFHNAEHHLLKAWDVVGHGGKIVCLFPSAMLERRRVHFELECLKTIIDEYGKVEQLGQCFVDADRKTAVDVSMIVLEKPNSKEHNYFSNFKLESEDHQRVDFKIDEPTALSNPDAVNGICETYRKAMGAYADFLQAKNKVAFFARALGVSARPHDLMPHKYSYSDEDYYNAFADYLTADAWSMVFKATGMEAFMTRKVRNEFNAFKEGHQRLDLTPDNIAFVANTLGMSYVDIMRKATLDVFEQLTRHDKNNSSYWEGWATNSAHKVNRKVIIPNVIECCSHDGKARMYYGRALEEIEDIDRVMCNLSGRQWDEIVTIRKAIEANLPNWTAPEDSTFFKIKYHKKGTVHLEFKDLELLETFNRLAAEGKRWLPREQ